MKNTKPPPKTSQKGKWKTKVLTLMIEGKPYQVTTVYKPVKTMRMYIRRGCDLTLSVPLTTTMNDIKRFCQNQGKRIVEKMQTVEARPVAYAMLTVKNGDTFPCFGETLRVVVEKGNRGEARREGKTLYLTLRNPENGEAVNRLFHQWQKETAKAYMTYLCECEFDYFKGKGIAFPEIGVKAFSAKWGTCYYTVGRIVFTTAIMYTSPNHARYVALHELTHFIHHDHGAGFYGLIDKLMPSWRAYKAEAAVLLARPK